MNYDNFKWAIESPCSARPAPGAIRTDSETVIKSKIDTLKIYPNPFDNYIIIEYPGIDNAQIQVYDMSGTLRMTTRGFNSNLMINVGRYLAKGMYMLKITGTNKSIVKKIIVQ